ncbi:MULTISPECIES: RNA polymerase factor sigma-54 [Syntrophothermus]|uniref:RNA polymerase, sigma 54 subunit, RpoN n=1 Tax=Syntrophothermus lipocalidus (strain DSM 12680 / TGB-C1) TaxID=643648 RepID=D7CPH3_SYNLT|nr:MULTISPECIES: RNA polymerase factor sigma-54 [Syntrophothermus]ADI02608.1 RNA polymerase, sigma 54 subunit, RpoN [Syntrophothermus lipocalidus DSM 12680]NSW84106.1 RNA polymerase factor sigma-54 [Syntrophothermus sp.]
MRLIHDLSLEQRQKLIITPELRQAIAILQMSALELDEYLQQELAENPFLELKDDPEPVEVELKSEDEGFETEWWEYFLDRSDLGYLGPKEKSEESKGYENLLTKAPTLHEHLLFQADITLSDEDMVIGEFLIGCIDDNGYLRVGIAEAAQHLGVANEQVEKVLKVIQTFEPYGVGARSLSECLCIQLVQTGKINPVAEKIVREHLDDLGKGRVAKIAARMGISVKDVQETADLIRTLDPKPGRQYGNSYDIRYLVPDVIVERINGEYVIQVCEGNLPRLVINQFYQNMLKQPGLFGHEAKKFMEDRFASALWIIRSIEHRRLTLYKVASCIVEVQREFLDKGVKYLKPLNLKQVADMIGVHESTISRATAGKYIQTPQGVFELKYFFGSAVSAAEGIEKYASRSVKKLIKEMIDAEDARNPLSDQKIAEVLEQSGIKISRRTVAKYRTELGIMSTSARKRY